MKDESKRRKPKKEKMEQLMELTFYDRRQMLSEGPQAIITSYPWLLKESAVCTSL